MARKILLVDDEPLILKGLKYSLEQDGYQTDSAMDGEEALTKFFAGEYDLILLDVMLPGVDGIEVCQRIREKSNVPIIMLTAKGEDMDKILGLEYGADDYMTKPFNILEVKARIKSIFRRSQPQGAPRLDLRCPAHAAVQADAPLLGMLVDTLVRNACAASARTERSGVKMLNTNGHRNIIKSPVIAIKPAPITMQMLP